jgi:neutral ceramidase
VQTDVAKSYTAGDTAFAVFVGANPRNNLRLEQTYLTVDRLSGSTWTPYRSDSHPSTRFVWNRTSTILGTSTANVSWTVEAGTPAGSYRLTYYGDSKPLIGSISSFVGHSATFTVS